MSTSNDLAVQNFQEYLRIPSVHPNVDYSDCVKFLKELADSIDLPYRVIHLKPTKPVVLMTWKGKRHDLPSVLLNSHMDVVQVFEEEWKHKPFAAEIEDGKIYGRGAQDMKCVGIQYLEAIRRMKQEGISCLRDIHICFVPDEEIGGLEGMKLFVETEVFKKLNIGVSLDEGAGLYTFNKFPVFYAEKCLWQFSVHCRGQTGHGSLLLDDTPGEKASYILNKVYEFRKQQKLILTGNPDYSLGQVTSINCTKIKGGVQSNVIPYEISITFDCRIAPTSLNTFEDEIKRWCEEAGSNCSIEFHIKEEMPEITKLDENIYWPSFLKAAHEMSLELRPLICAGTTDSRYLRQKGITSFGFSPINNTPLLIHGHDEFIGIDTFLKGIDIYIKVIIAMANTDYVNIK